MSKMSLTDKGWDEMGGKPEYTRADLERAYEQGQEDAYSKMAFRSEREFEDHHHRLGGNEIRKAEGKFKGELIGYYYPNIYGVVHHRKEIQAFFARLAEELAKADD